MCVVGKQGVGTIGNGMSFVRFLKLEGWFLLEEIGYLACYQPKKELSLSQIGVCQPLVLPVLTTKDKLFISNV